MATTMSTSSSLHVLERYNRSKSTVSSSDTDADSAGYASSSGTTTPEDDSQTFHLSHTFPNSPADDKCGLRAKPTIVTKYRHLAFAMKRVKKVAHALVVFKKKRPDDISPILISSPLRERFGKRMSVKPQPDEGFYNLPNRRFSLSDVSAPSVNVSPSIGVPCVLTNDVPMWSMFQRPPQTITRKFGTISGSASTPSFANGSFMKRRSGLHIPSFSESPHNALPPPTRAAVVPRTEHSVLTFRMVLVHVLRILLFVPWCATVGGALLLFPNYIELVAFRTGYLPSPKGIRRFAHWAECGQQHVMIFLACLVVVFWYNRALGLSLTSIAVSRFVFVWRGFEVNRSIPLGEDDQQSLYIVVMGLVSEDGWLSVSGPIKKTERDEDK